MAHRRSTRGGGVLVFGLALAIVIAQWVEDHLAAFLLVGLVSLGLWLAVKASRATQRRASAASERPLPVRAAKLGAREPSSDAPARTGASLRHEMQPTPWGLGADEAWVPANERATLAGRSLGGLLYVGSGLASMGGQRAEPALIDPTLPIAQERIDPRASHLPYGPSYSEASPQARAAYLDWLASGRSEPGVDLGYVFLYFYGLERRAVHDARSSESARGQLPAIETEVRRLMDLYGGRSTFGGYAQRLLDFLEARRREAQGYRRAPPLVTVAGVLSSSFKVGLGQCAADGVGLPVDWALAWLRGASAARMRVPAVRCAGVFDRHFRQRYQLRYPQGLALRRNRTRLRLLYAFASPYSHRVAEPCIEPLDLPDVSILTEPWRALQGLADECCDDLDGYSRWAAKHPDQEDSREGLLELPLGLWPARYREPIDSVAATVERTSLPLALPFQKLRAWLPDTGSETFALSKREYSKLCQRFGEAGVDITNS